jgi:hypothetical protein
MENTGKFLNLTNISLRVLIACEYSGTVRDAFNRLGHKATSCDILPTEAPGDHYQGDVLDILHSQHWDLVIAHPPCTRLTVTANKWYKPEYAQRFPNIQQERKDAIKFFMEFANCKADSYCIENPVGIMSTIWRKPDQIIQPYEFGHIEAKKTCLWLKNLPLLQKDPADLKVPEYITFKSGKRMAKWYVDAAKNKKTRAHMRDKTFEGVANAFAEQWGGLVVKDATDVNNYMGK